jgi:tripartite ATP-independent transporter DctM subunit
MLLVAIVFIVFLFLGMPVAFAIGISGFLFFLQHLELPITIPIQVTISQTQNFALLAVPMFIFAGNLLNKAGITQRLMDLASVLTGHLRGGLAQISAVLSTLMGGVSGSCIADAAMECRMLGPEMVKRGYSRGFAVAVNVWTSLIVPTIPPGIGLILYGTVGQVSIGRLFAGGILPGLLLMFFFMITISYAAKKRGYLPEREHRASFREITKATSRSIWAILFPFLLLFGLRFGIFTPSEVGSFAVIYGLGVGLFAYRELSLKKLGEVLNDTITDVGAVMYLIALSGIFGYGIVFDRIPEVIANSLLGLSSNPFVLIFVIVLFLIIAGMFVDGSVLILMLTPILLPVARQVGFDPVHFGLIFVLTVTLGNMTPPVGSAMYAGCAVLDTPIEEYIHESGLFFVAAVIAIALLIFLPQIVLFLPNLLFG